MVEEQVVTIMVEVKKYVGWGSRFFLVENENCFNAKLYLAVSAVVEFVASDVQPLRDGIEVSRGLCFNNYHFSTCSMGIFTFMIILIIILLIFHLLVIT